MPASPWLGYYLLRHLLLLLRSFWHCFRGVTVTVTLRVVHLSITVGAAALMIRVELLANFRFRVGLKVFVDTFIILVGTTAVGWRSIVTGREIFVLEGSCQDSSRL